jgi:hypothetical protein
MPVSTKMDLLRKQTEHKETEAATAAIYWDKLAKKEKHKGVDKMASENKLKWVDIKSSTKLQR